jgi:hypothetical protein
VLIESFGVLTLVLGIVWATYLFAFGTAKQRRYDEYRIRIGRTLLLVWKFSSRPTSSRRWRSS